MTQTPQKIGIFGDGFRHDITRAFECGLHICHFGREIGFRKLYRIGSTIRPDGIRQGSQSALAGDLCLGAALRLIGQIEVFQFRLGGGARQLQRQFVRHLALAVDAIDDRGASGFQLAEINQSFCQRAQLRIVKPACDFLTIARDEGNRRALVQQPYCGGRLIRASVDFCGNGRGESLLSAAMGLPVLECVATIAADRGKATPEAPIPQLETACADPSP